MGSLPGTVEAPAISAPFLLLWPKSPVFGRITGKTVGSQDSKDKNFLPLLCVSQVSRASFLLELSVI